MDPYIFINMYLLFFLRRRCEHDGASLVSISSENEETIMHDFAVNFKQQLWIGLHSVQVYGIRNARFFFCLPKFTFTKNVTSAFTKTVFKLTFKLVHVRTVLRIQKKIALYFFTKFFLRKAFKICVQASSL